MPRIDFRTLGTLDLRRADGFEIHSLLVQPKRVALLAYLCAAKPLGFHRRDSVIALLWPEADQARGRTSLRSSLHALRRSLGDDVLQSRGDEEIAVDFQAIRCDASDFEDLVGRKQLPDALDLYRGNFLEGFFIDGAPGFERWLESERPRLRGLAVSAAHSLSKELEASGNLSDAVALARRAVELSDKDEKEVRHLIGLLAKIGNLPAAIQSYDDLARHLAQEYEAQPSAETRALIAGLRSKNRSNDPALVPVTEKGAEDRATHYAEKSPVAPMPLAPTPAKRPSGTFHTRRLALVALAASAIALGTVVGLRAANGKRPSRETRQKLTASGDAMMASLSPNGEFLAYVTQAGDSQSVIVNDIAAGTHHVLKRVTGAIWSLEWSPDGTRVLMGGFGSAIVLPRLGATSSTMGPELGGQLMGYWLPDSARLSVHESGSKRVLVFDPRTQDTLAIPVIGSYTWLDEGSWSPAGHTFAVMTESNDPLSWEIRTVRVDSVNQLIVQDTVPLGSPRWSRDGRFLYYARALNSVWRITVDPNTGASRGAPEEIAGDLQMYSQRFGLVHFALSSDRRAMLYSRGARFSNLWIVTLDTSESPKTLPLTTGTLLRWSPVASPDGQWIAFAQESKSGGELFRIPAGGGAPQQLSQGARVHPESQIAWSPSGEEIAFSSIRGGYAQVWSAKVDNGRMRAFTGTRVSTSTGHLTWAPGTRIAYQRSDHKNIHLIDPASGLEQALINDTTPGAVHSPRYSPDGQQLAFFSFRRVNGTGIRVFDSRNSTFIKAAGGVYPRGWSRDGRFVYFQLPQSPVVYRIEPGNPQTKPVAVLSPPFREAQCAPMGASRPSSFICAAFNFVSDIWRIDNFDQLGN